MRTPASRFDVVVPDARLHEIGESAQMIGRLHCADSEDPSRAQASRHLRTKRQAEIAGVDPNINPNTNPNNSSIRRALEKRPVSSRARNAP